MTSVMDQTSSPAPVPSNELLEDLVGVSGRRRTKNAVMTGLMFASVAIIAIVLGFVLVTVISKGWGIVHTKFPHWFTDDIPPTARRVGPGMKAAIVGTIVTTLTATVIAVPLGIAGAVYLNEYGKRNVFARLLRFLTGVMAGVPSIVMGLFIYVFWVLPRHQEGLTGLAGAFALACLMLPIVVRATEEMLKLVPQNLRDASYALGATRSRTTLTVVIPKASAGIISGCLLAVARASGETAPLIFTVSVGASAVHKTNWNVFSGPNTALSLQIYANAKETLASAQDRGWGAALTLIALAFLFTLVARVMSARLSKKTQ
ncbi:MAG: phosphate transporter inner rane subunit PstA [Ilumatobacteraceae bacterium]|nr:phosphate transporter inner rane subunit PstA [Ilumatobacteraceae bacterium]